jgi:flagellar L-ring protein precursor FlgH
MTILSLSLLASLALAQDVPTRPDVPVSENNTNNATTGSLWDDVHARRLVGLDGSARQVGDLITVHISENSTTDLGASTELSKSSEVTAQIDALAGLDKKVLAALQYVDKIEIGAGSTGNFSGSGKTSRDSQVQATITCEVIEVMPTGNLHIWGTKSVRVNEETQFIVLEGTVRPRDVQMDNTVSSDMLAEAKVEITGTGVIADKQSPGFFARVLDWLWPF